MLTMLARQRVAGKSGTNPEVFKKCGSPGAGLVADWGASQLGESLDADSRVVNHFEGWRVALFLWESWKPLTTNSAMGKI